MPNKRVPVEPCSLSDTDSHVDDMAFKIDAGSERSSSPKSDGSVSEVSDTSEASLCLEFSEVSDSLAPQTDILIEDFDCMKLNEEQAEEMARHGADMRHVLCTSWKLQSKVGKKYSSKAASMTRTPPGQALRDMAHAQKISIEEHERCLRQINGGANRRRHPSLAGQRTATTGEVFGIDADAPDAESQILVSYADGSNSLTLADKPLCLHNITVSCAVDSCHVFIQQMKNPTYEGLHPLEMAMAEAFEEEASPPLLRPIAHGSLLAVNMDDKWYRCQVVSFNSHADSCDIKFVDHGGYTTVQVSDLRPLRSDFVRLPFQAIEVYVAHVSPATDEIIIDIASDLLFRDNVSIQLLGFAEDGTPIVQAYFYQNDYINLLTQDILDDCYQVFLNAHPNYTPVPTQAQVSMTDDETSCSAADYDSSEDTETASSDDLCQLDQHYSTDEGVWSPEGSVHTSSEQHDDDAEVDHESISENSDHVCKDVVPEENSVVEPASVAWVAAPAVLAYCVPDLNTGLVYYVPVVQAAAPCYPDTTYLAQPQQEINHVADQTELQCHDDSYQSDFSKPFEEWSQEDYELYYNQN